MREAFSLNNKQPVMVIFGILAILFGIAFIPYSESSKEAYGADWVLSLSGFVVGLLLISIAVSRAYLDLKYRYNSLRHTVKALGKLKMFDTKKLLEIEGAFIDKNELAKIISEPLTESERNSLQYALDKYNHSKNKKLEDIK